MQASQDKQFFMTAYCLKNICDDMFMEFISFNDQAIYEAMHGPDFALINDIA